jgi:hypothetical protein
MLCWNTNLNNIRNNIAYDLTNHELETMPKSHNQLVRSAH